MYIPAKPRRRLEGSFTDRFIVFEEPVGRQRVKRLDLYEAHLAETEESERLTDFNKSPAAMVLAIRDTLADFGRDMISVRHGDQGPFDIDMTFCGLMSVAIETAIASGTVANSRAGFAFIDEERHRQDRIWGPAPDSALKVEDWILILESQLQQAAALRLKEVVADTPGASRPEYQLAGSFAERMLKFAAVCVAAVESLPDDYLA